MFTKKINIELSKRPNNGRFKKGVKPWNFKRENYKFLIKSSWRSKYGKSD